MREITGMLVTAMASANTSAEGTLARIDVTVVVDAIPFDPRQWFLQICNCYRLGVDDTAQPEGGWNGVDATAEDVRDAWDEELRRFGLVPSTGWPSGSSLRDAARARSDAVVAEWKQRIEPFITHVIARAARDGRTACEFDIAVAPTLSGSLRETPLQGAKAT